MKFSTALTLSLVAHLLVAVGVGVYIAYTPPVTLAQLDLTSVELSFAEDEAEVAPPAPLPPVPPPPPAPRPPDARPPEPKPLPLPNLISPTPESVSLPEPPPEPVQLPPPPPPPPSPPPVAAPKQARVQVDKPPSPRKAIRPDYPKESRQAGEEGDVVLEIRVTAKGRVDAVQVIASSGFPRLDEAAIRAAQSARFTPAQSDGRAVASTARLTLTFKLK